MNKNSKSAMKKEPKAKRAKAQRPVQRDTKEVLAELVEKLIVIESADFRESVIHRL